MNSASVRISKGPSTKRVDQILKPTLRKDLVACGVLASILYAAMNVFVPMLDPAYSPVTQTVSELSAIGAPTRTIWVVLGMGYTILFVSFGFGVWMSAQQSRALRVTGALLIFGGLFGIFWPPIHLRGEGFTLTDSLHIAWTAVWGVLTMLAMGFSAFAFGKKFRWFAFLSIALLLGFGAMTSLEAPNITKNLPTPTIGVWERLNIGVFLVWLAVLAIALLRMQDAAPEGSELT